MPSRWRRPIAAPTVAAEGMAEMRSSSETWIEVTLFSSSVMVEGKVVVVGDIVAGAMVGDWGAVEGLQV